MLVRSNLSAQMYSSSSSSLMSLSCRNLSNAATFQSDGSAVAVDCAPVPDAIMSPPTRAPIEQETRTKQAAM
ncbi:hypothetical protein GUJ93_ZPchr0025g2902 [Zizania palustris]|uniref:Uncharacterized protein n=1 Tax=Zizania palustris TaxID=103762 RepID=A0A8J5V8H1_ZIZPA|nr:hypothetical protein GUJ93_ZPchr0025g2902 [Zizania palustris]